MTLTELHLYYYSSSYHIACFKVTVESYSVATQTAERRRGKTYENRQRSRAGNAVRNQAEGGVKFFYGLEAHGFLKAAVDIREIGMWTL
jgi:hypothetical protein